MACARRDQSRQPNKDRGVAILAGSNCSEFWHDHQGEDGSRRLATNISTVRRE
jgi:hypothetical protein